MLAFWYDAFPQYPKSHIEFWRVRLICHMTLIMTVFFTVIAALNFFVFQDLFLTIMDIVGAVLVVSIHFWFRTTGNVNLAAWLITVMLSTLLMFFIYSVDGMANSFIWATLTPPIAFFLLGKRWGSIITALMFLFCCFIAYEQYHNQLVATYSFGSVLNMVEVSLAHILLFRFYESTRSDAYEELSISHQKTQMLAETDKLTGLYNRTKLDFSLTRMLKDAKTHNRPFTLLIVDVDHFKLINDELGHLMGDEILKKIATYLKSHIQQYDVVARWGGEEFVIIMSEPDSAKALTFAQNVCELFSCERFQNRQITISIGLTTWASFDTADTLLRRADDALYQAKAEGRNRAISILADKST